MTLLQLWLLDGLEMKGLFIMELATKEPILTPIRLTTEWTESEVLMGTTENLLDYLD